LYTVVSTVQCETDRGQLQLFSDLRIRWIWKPLS